MEPESCKQFFKEHAEIEMARRPKKYPRPKGMRKWKREYMRRLRQDPLFKLSDNTSRAVRLAMKGNKLGRSWETLVGYTAKDLREHLESQFDSSMSWDNYGSYWNIDHKKPISWFAREEIREAWALENLRPVEVCENYVKGNRYCTV